MSKKYYDFIQVGALVLSFVSVFLIYQISSIIIFKYIGVISLIIALVFPMFYYLKYKKVYFDGKVCKGKEAILVLIMDLVAVIILIIVFF